nr:hypothetical protein [Tanacetum cinerariifolium]
MSRRNCQSKVAVTLNTTTTDKASDETGTKSGRTVTLTAEDMQKKNNDVKARTTLLLSLLDEHQLRFSKYKTTRSDTTTTDKASDETGTKSGRTITLTAEDMQKKNNDVKARTTLLLSLLDEHQLRFSKYKTTRELWAAILKTFGGNEATKKTKKNLLKQQYGKFRVKGSETLEQMFSRLQVIIGQLQFMDIEVKQNDLNQKFLTSLALE